MYTKITILIIATILLQYTQQLKFDLIKEQTAQCTEFTFGNEGAGCLPDTVNKTSDSRCKRTLVCKNNKCQDGFYNSKCLEHSDCWGNENTDEGIRCINTGSGVKRCMKEKYAGAKCTYKDECFSGSCIDNKCYGAPLGAPCIPTGPATCAKGLYCSFSKKQCTTQLKLEDSCNDLEPKQDETTFKAGSNYRVICPGGSRCTGIQGSRTCRPFHIKKIGETCHHVSECTTATRCTNNKCVDANLDQNRRQHDCPGFHRKCQRLERCVCDGTVAGKGKCVETGNGNQNCGMNIYAQKWQECQKRYNCAHDPELRVSILYDTFAEGTCMWENCRHVARNWLCCLYGGKHDNIWSHLIDLPDLHPECDAGVDAGTVLFILFLLVVVVGGIVGAAVGGVFYYKKYHMNRDGMEQLE